MSRRWFSGAAARGTLQLALLATTALFVAALVGPARADEATQTAYSTSKNGQRLKWGPQRPTVRAVQEQAAAADEVAIPATQDERPTVAVAHVEPTPASKSAVADAFDDPFGDRTKSGAAPSAPRKTVSAGTRSAGVVSTAQRKLRPVSQRDEVPDFPVTGRPTTRSAAVALQPTPAKDPAPADLNDAFASVDPSMKSASHCPDKLEFKPLKDVKTDLKPFKGMRPEECTMVGKPYEPRNWSETVFTWKASSLCHKPLYFEEVQLERYGHYWGPIVQPFLSAGHFFVSIPLLPYNMGLNPPNECIYSLGYYRPGSCSPYMLDPFPFSVRAGLMEAGAVTGLVFVLP